MDKKSNKYKKLEQEIVYIQQKLNEIIKSRHDRLEDGIVIFKPTEGLTLDDWKKFIDNEKLLDWNAITLKGDVTPTLFEFYKRLQILQDLAQKDPLTGLANRKRLIEVLNLEVERSYRTSQPLCVFFLDIDNFKKISDTMGHDIGDLVLKEVAKLLKSQCRKTDFICRYGGEKFAIIFPSTTLFHAEITGNRIREALKKIEIKGPNNRSFHITCSIGISCYKGRKKINPEILLKKADKAMYEAKNSGKDKVITAGFVDIDLESFKDMVKVNAEEKQFLFSKKIKQT